MADLSVTAASVLPVATQPNPSKIVQGTFGATVTQGQSVYLDPVSGTWKPAQATALVNAGGSAPGNLGIAMNSGAINQPASILVGGDWTVGATLVLGQTYVVSAAVAGNIAPVGDLIATNFPSLLGVAISTTVCRMPQAGPIVSGVAHG